MGMSLLTLQTITVSLPFIVTENWPGQNTYLHFFAKTFYTKGFGRYGSDKGSVTYGRTDIRRGKKQYMSLAGGDI